MLAERFAPVVLYDVNEPNLPVSVDAFLAQTSLNMYSAGCTPDTTPVSAGPLSQPQLMNVTTALPCDARSVVSSTGTRSSNKQGGFFLADIPTTQRSGGRSSNDWTTYYHAYSNAGGGTTIQYWRFYAFNTGPHFSVAGIAVDLSHGGDWETADIVLDATAKPESVRVNGHVHIRTIPWSSAEQQNGRLVIYAERGGHESHEHAPPGWVLGARHEQWTDGRVTLSTGIAMPAGPLVDLGSKLAPKQPFVRYSGLWGSPGFNYFKLPPFVKGLIENAVGQPLSNFTSGYWGPAFNETDRGTNGFITAWCIGSKEPESTANGVRECYPDHEIP